MGLLGAAHTYPTMMTLGTVIPYPYLKKIKKNINDLTHPMSSADISVFFYISRNTDSRNIDCILMHNLQFF